MTDAASRAATAREGAATTAVERVTALLRDEILSGALGPDAPLREELAATRYGVSRHTVRSAFQRLVAERLAIAEPYRGVRVTSFDDRQVLALQQLRAALEVEAVRIAFARYGGTLPDEALAPARAAVDAMASLGPSADRPGEAPGEAWLEVERLHADFHAALVAASGSPRIVEAHAALGSELLLFILHARPHYSVASLVEEHRRLLEELPERGPAALREHLEHSTALLLG
ncbi:GntR family transcriptional regulator [Agromyces aurantiacus]|uniref:GntR family transcriptional regulator n=1 Tax=Agromyces aurantiacus TaxID=165814 RepID=A0ABV9R4K6_9MICO|nr:GntR family transcriptional regulator [Agromyces aurantiacus]MBM7503065.1 DNA-binding GntR family transcriptional regulator [Agromyces aurantiacus]